MVSDENGVADPSSRSVSDNWVRNSGTPYSSSWLDTDGQGRRRTRSRVRATISWRCIVMNSYNMHPSNGAGDSELGNSPVMTEGCMPAPDKAAQRGSLTVTAYPQPIRKRCH